MRRRAARDARHLVSRAGVSHVSGGRADRRARAAHVAACAEEGIPVCGSD